MVCTNAECACKYQQLCNSFKHMLAFLDILLTIVHGAVIGFNLVGWIFNKTRRAHLMLVGLTLLSWFVLGIFHGWGYCFLTDWHWQIKWKRGEYDLPNDFITYAVQNGLGLNVHSDTIATTTLITFLCIVVLSLFFNLINLKCKSQ